MTERLLICLIYSAVALVAVLATSSQAHAKTSSTALRRYALIIGSNTGGGQGRDKLRYAGHDAARVADVLKQIGGVTQPDLALLSEPDLRGLDDAFDALSKRVRDERQKGQRIELVVYYSGHADDSGILIGGGRYDYARLRQRIRAVPADVHIAIVDSCASGSFTRIKGGKKLPPFLRDTSNQVAGFAFLSSSSENEDAQESDRIGASFFTYFFVAALRGAADRNRDGKITLTEAYQFSYEHTLGRTQNTAHGPQHPAYDMHLSGTGDVVITDLRSTESSLILPPALKGRVTIVDKTGRVAVELTKEAGEPLSLALPNETYTIHVDNKKGEFIATVTLDKVGSIELEPGALRPATDKEKTVARGLSIEEDNDDDDDDDDDHRSRKDKWEHEVRFGFGSGMRVEVPQDKQAFEALITLGGASRQVYGRPVIGVASVGEISLGMTVGGDEHFAYDTHLGFGPGIYLGTNLQVGATIGLGFSGITGNVMPFAWKMPTEVFAVLSLSDDIRPMAYVRQTYVFDTPTRTQHETAGWWGDEAEAGAGLHFSGKLDGFVYGSVREIKDEKYWGLGMGAIF